MRAALLWTSCGTQRLLRPLSGPCILLATAPTAPPCFGRRPQSSPLQYQRKYYFYICKLEKSADFSNLLFHGRGRNGKMDFICGTTGSFSEDRPLGWDPVAAGNRAGDGMACNSNDRRQWRKQEVAVGTAASRMRVLLKARSIRWVPQPVLVSEEKSTRWPTLAVIPPNDNRIPTQ